MEKNSGDIISRFKRDTKYLLRQHCIEDRATLKRGNKEVIIDLKFSKYTNCAAIYYDVIGVQEYAIYLYDNRIILMVTNKYNTLGICAEIINNIPSKTDPGMNEITYIYNGETITEKLWFGPEYIRKYSKEISLMDIKPAVSTK